MTGALAFTAVTLPSSRSPRGEFLAPFTLFQTPPPMAPMAKAPPMSSKMRCGQGSRSCTDMLLRRDACCQSRCRRPWTLGSNLSGHKLALLASSARLSAGGRREDTVRPWLRLCMYEAPAPDVRPLTHGLGGAELLSSAELAASVGPATSLVPHRRGVAGVAAGAFSDSASPSSSASASSNSDSSSASSEEGGEGRGWRSTGFVAQVRSTAEAASGRGPQGGAHLGCAW